MRISLTARRILLFWRKVNSAPRCTIETHLCFQDLLYPRHPLRRQSPFLIDQQPDPHPVPLPIMPLIKLQLLPPEYYMHQISQISSGLSEPAKTIKVDRIFPDPIRRSHSTRALETIHSGTTSRVHDAAKRFCPDGQRREASSDGDGRTTRRAHGRAVAGLGVEDVRAAADIRRGRQTAERGPTVCCVFGAAVFLGRACQYCMSRTGGVPDDVLSGGEDVFTIRLPLPRMMAPASLSLSMSGFSRFPRQCAKAVLPRVVCRG